MPNMTISSITKGKGSWWVVEAQDMALIPRTFHQDMTEQEVQAASLEVGLEIEVSINGIWTVKKGSEAASAEAKAAK